jgi:hypothetical protein
MNDQKLKVFGKEGKIRPPPPLRYCNFDGKKIKKHILPRNQTSGLATKHL